MTSPLTEYLNSIAQFPLLTFREELDLSKKIQAGIRAYEDLTSGVIAESEDIDQIIEDGKKARQKLVEGNLKLVVSIAKKYRTPSTPLMDLIQTGNLGLIRAAEKYDYTYQNRFSTYAVFWIEQSIVSCIEQDNPIRLPSHVSETASKVRKTYQRLTELNFREPTPEEVCLELKLPMSKVLRLLDLALRPLSLDMETETGTPMGDFLESSDPSPETQAVDQDVSERLGNILKDALTEKERRVIWLRYGFRDGQGWSQERIGEVMRVSRQRVAQIEKRAKEKLRAEKYQPALAAMLG